MSKATIIQSSYSYDLSCIIANYEQITDGCSTKLCNTVAIVSLNCLCNGVLENVSILCIYTTSFRMPYINKVVLKEHVRIAHSIVTYSIEVTCADIRDV